MAENARFKHVSEDEISNLIVGKSSKSTERVIESAKRVFQQFCKETGRQILGEGRQSSKEELNEPKTFWHVTSNLQYFKKAL